MRLCEAAAHTHSQQATRLCSSQPSQPSAHYLALQESPLPPHTHTPQHTHTPNTHKHPRYINLSLHYLEQVIVALQERSIGISRCVCLRMLCIP